jgi:hypothetical protein
MSSKLANLLFIAGGFIVGASGVYLLEVGSSWIADGVFNLLPNKCPLGFGQEQTATANDFIKVQEDFNKKLQEKLSVQEVNQEIGG